MAPELRPPSSRSLLIGFAFVAAVFAVVFYPGYVSFDIASQLAQGRSGQLSDVSPPANALLLAIAFALGEGTGPLFLLNTLLICASTAWILAVLNLRKAHWLLLICALPLLPILPHVWTDVHLLASLSLATALLLYASSAESPRAARLACLAALVLLAWSTWVRHNAILAVIPLAILPFYIRSGRTSLAARTGVIALVVLALVLIRATSSLVVERPSSVWAVTLMWDLQHLSIERGEVLFPPAFVGPGMDIADLEQAFSPNTAVPLFAQTRSGVRNPTLAPFDAGMRAEIWAAWIQAVLSDPQHWLAHRWTVFHRLFGPHWHGDLVEMVDSPVFLESGGRALWRSRLHELARLAMESGKRAGVFAPWPGFLLSIALLVASRLRGRGAAPRLQAALVVSALAYIAALFPLTPSAEQRYLVWPLWALIVAAALALSQPNDGDDRTSGADPTDRTGG
jgi:hypothetical protein